MLPKLKKKSQACLACCSKASTVTCQILAHLQCFGSVLVVGIICLACVSGEHAISRAPNELEVAMTIAHYYQLQPNSAKNLERAIQQAASSTPPCHKYIKSIGDFVQSFAGGESFQLLKYMDFISFLAACVSFQSFRPLQAHSAHAGSFQPIQACFSQYRLVSANKGFFQPVQAHVWEQWFIPLLQLRSAELLAYCDWKQGSTTFPMLRVALACCQVTSPRASQKDGFAKLITKSVFDKLKGKTTSWLLKL